MKIYYDNNKAKWYQSSMEAPVTFGGNKQAIPFLKSPTASSFHISLNLDHNHAGPLIGILTGRRIDGTIAGNSALFIKLQKKLIAHGGFSFIFTPENVFDDHMNGYAFIPDDHFWKKVMVPYPDFVYNRVPFRKVEQTEQCQMIFTMLKEKGIPFFNPCFLDKYELYQLFQKHPVLTNFLPKTEIAADKERLYSFLSEHENVYLKPSCSAKGKGIFRLSITPSKQLFLEGMTINEVYSSIHSFWEEWKTELTTKHYLIQEEIKSEQYEGKKFDLRILAHAENDGYSITGVGIRQTQNQNLTTHIPNGGKLLPYTLFQTDKHDQFIKFAVNEIGKTLSLQYGYFGEFSIDAGINKNGEYYIYEVNSKPMSFDEKNIEEQKITQLCRLFFQETKFPFTNEISSNTIN